MIVPDFEAWDLFVAVAEAGSKVLERRVALHDDDDTGRFLAPSQSEALFDPVDDMRRTLQIFRLGGAAHAEIIVGAGNVER